MSNKEKAIHGAKWTTASTVFSAVVQFAQVAIVARLLVPASFGIVSVSTLVINFLSIFVHFGFANSIIYKQESDRKVLSTIYFLNICMGLLMFCLIYFSAPLLIAYYNEPKIGHVLRTAALYFPIVFLGQIYNILLEKELRFKSVALINICCAAINTAITIILAYRGFEAMALIYGLLGGQLVQMVVLNIAGRQYFSPMWHFRLSEIREHLKFGLFNVGDSILNFANSNVDTILIGGLLGVKELGYYTIASQIAVYPVVRICPIIMQICYPIMAKMKGNLQGLKNAYLKMMDFTAYCIIPLLSGLFITAANVIPMIYGPGWEPTVPLIRIFVFMGIFTSLQYPLSPLAYSTGKPNLLFYLNLATFALKLPVLLLLGKYYGVVGIATGFLICTFISMMINFVIVQRIAGSYVPQLLTDIYKPILFSVAMVAAIVVYQKLFGNAGTLHTIVQIVIGGLIYLALTIKYKISVKEMMAVIRPTSANQ